MCGETITFTYSTKQTRYCAKCKHEAYLRRQRNIREQKKAKKYLNAHADRIAHQQDTSVWTHDYAQRQMQKTLAMIGGVGSDM